MDDEVNTIDSNIPPEEFDFAKLLADLADNLVAGAEISLSEVCRSYPQFDSRLRELWGTLVVARAAGSFSRSMLEYDPEFSQALPLPCDFGDYVIESEIGRGGMGVVFKASKKANDRLVAIKMIINGEFASQSQRARFLAEGKVVADLHHPHIVPVLEVGEFKNTPFICMEYIEGYTLSDLVESNRLTQREICELVIKVCDAIQYAHNQGVFHRDIKPSNILVDETGEPCLVDFGLAKQLSLSNDLTRSGAILGTPVYMSPEQASGSRNLIGAETDVYGLGAVMYFMTTNQPPFSGTTVVDVLFKVLEQEPASPRSLNAEISKDMEKVILHCMQKTKDQRYSSPDALASDLNAILREEPIARDGIAQTLGRVMRETHHASVMNHWGIIWIWNSLVILFASVTTHMNYVVGVDHERGYLATWAGKLVLWGLVFWLLRRRMGPVTFVERQLAHVWAACFSLIVIACAIEPALGLRPLALSPLWAVTCGMAFFINAGILSGTFYVHAVALLACAGLMLAVPHYAVLTFGATLSACFLLSGLKYYRRRSDSEEEPGRNAVCN